VIIFSVKSSHCNTFIHPPTQANVVHQIEPAFSISIIVFFRFCFICSGTFANLFDTFSPIFWKNQFVSGDV
jgi:hypothetical protein